MNAKWIGFAIGGKKTQVDEPCHEFDTIVYRKRRKVKVAVLLCFQLRLNNASGVLSVLCIIQQLYKLHYFNFIMIYVALAHINYIITAIKFEILMRLL